MKTVKFENKEKKAIENALNNRIAYLEAHGFEIIGIGTVKVDTKEIARTAYNNLSEFSKMVSVYDGDRTVYTIDAKQNIANSI